MNHSEEIAYLLSAWTEDPRKATVNVKKTFPELFEKVSSQGIGSTFSEKSWNWIYTKPNCYCGASTKYLNFRDGYRKYCSVKCMVNSPEEINKRKITNEKKYGVDHYSKTAEYKEKFVNTCLNKFGVSNPGQREDNKNIRSRKKQFTFFSKVLEQVKDEYSPKFTFDQYTHLRDHALMWGCLACGKDFTSNLLDKLPKCPNCFPNRFGGPSSVEKDILSEIAKFYQGEIIPNSRQIIKPKELDIYFPKEKFAIEVNGVYWHRTEKVGKTYHFDKVQACTEQGITLFMITDYEWGNNRDLIIRMIKHRLGMQKNKILARKCTVKQIEVAAAKEFLLKNHLHGFGNSSNHLGLFNADKLVAVCSYSTKNRFKKNNKNIEIIRFALDEVVIAGALGKFIKKINELHPETDIETYADLRYGTGAVYLKNNFKQTHISQPGYWYFHEKKLQHRLNWTKKKLVKLGHDPELTESQIMSLLGAVQIYDSGHAHFLLDCRKVDNKSNT
jgi:hypothetical protein